MLDHLASFCVSVPGRQKCLALLPHSDPVSILREHRLFEDTRTWSSTARQFFHEFPDPIDLLDVLESGNAVTFDTDDFWALRNVLNMAKMAVRSILADEKHWPMLAKTAKEYPLPAMTLAALTRCLNDDGMIKDESSPELFRVRDALRSLHQSCLRRVRDFALQYNILQYLQEEYMTLASDRYVLPLKVNFKCRIQGIIHDYSNTGETCYFEPLFLVEQNNRLQELKQEEREEERKILVMLADVARSELPFIRQSRTLLIQLDVELAKCAFADKINAFCATLAEPHEGLFLYQARHPLLALDAQEPQPVDLILRPQDHVLIISGGNAGGKTVCLKTLGLLTAMTLAGLPIPAAKASVVPMWTDIQAFIGDEQSLDDHLSTFTAQVQHLAEIWDNTGSGSLILLDEFGAGTDPAQGAALAQSVLEELMARGAYVAAATHFPALKAYALAKEGVRAASVLFNPETKKPLFRLAYDQVGASLALDVAKEHGLPESVLRRAEHYLLLDSEDTSSMLEKLNALAVKREKEMDDLTAQEAALQEKYQKSQDKLERERQRLIAEVREAAKRVLNEWQSGRVAHRQALKELSEIRNKALPQEPPELQEQGPPVDISLLEIGQTVLHRPWNKKAVVREIDSRKNRVKLDLNGVTLWADATVLEKA